VSAMYDGGGSSIHEDVFTLPNGERCAVSWTENMSSADFEDFYEWLLLVLRKVRRHSQVGHPAPDQRTPEAGAAANKEIEKAHADPS